MTGEKRQGDGTVEIERKYLIRLPDTKQMRRDGWVLWRIRQTYLNAPPEVSRRVRAVRTAGQTLYTETIKRRINALSCYEEERAISRSAYYRLLREARADSVTLVKERYRFPYAGHMLEVDCYPFWRGTAVLEIELPDERETAQIPDFLTVLQDVTGDPFYKNAALARYLAAHPDAAVPPEG